MTRFARSAGTATACVIAALAVLAAPILPPAPAVAAPPADRIVADSSNPRWLFRADGRPVFLCGPGDPEGFLYRGTRQPDGTRLGDQETIIDRLAGTGANSLYVMAVRSHGGDGDATQNPFVDGDPARGLDEDILAQWRGWFESLDAAGVIVYLFLYDDSASVWDTGGTVGDAERSFVHAIVDRFEDLGHLVWCVAEEYSEALSPGRASALAAEIRAADDAGHPVAVHQRHGLDFDFADDPDVDQFAIQYNVATADGLHEGLRQAWDTADGRYQLNMSEAAGFGTGAEARRKSWACAMAGAYVMILGMDVVSTPIADLEDCGRLVQFFESTDFPSMEPRDELAASSTRWVLAAPGGESILYAPDASGPLGRTDLSPGTYTLRWFDCATGATAEQSGVPSAGGTTTWAVPSGIGPEVALHLVPEATSPVAAESWGGIRARYHAAE